MSFKQWQSEITQNLIETLQASLPQHQFAEVVKYSIFPTGKLFRPLLTYSIAKDLGNITTAHEKFAQALEIHHTYTLIHDDLPAMDDDDIRRGRASAHKQFSEWQAILSGDALLNLSYELLADIPADNLPQLLKEFSVSNGAKGLILGQVMDLAQEKQSIESILTLHELKTGRLIQLALVGSAIISGKQKMIEPLRELGKAIGLNFQLLDDLCELADPLSTHEQDINPFIHFKSQVLLDIVKENNSTINRICSEHQLQTTQNYANEYAEKIKTKLTKNISKIREHISLTDVDLRKIIEMN